MPLRFTLRQLEYFVAVGEKGSIAQASERVNVSSPSISAAISQLEEEFGLSLFVRKHAHGLSLTQAGRQFMDQAKRVLVEAEELNRLAGDISGIVQGPLNIGCLLTFAQMLLPAIRRAFEERFPNTCVRQIEADQLSLFERLRRADIDIALSYDLEIPPDLDFLPLRRLPPYAMLPFDHPLAEKVEVSIEDLVDHPMVLLDLPLSSNYFLSFFEGRQPLPENCRTDPRHGGHAFTGSQWIRLWTCQHTSEFGPCPRWKAHELCSAAVDSIGQCSSG